MRDDIGTITNYLDAEAIKKQEALKEFNERIKPIREEIILSGTEEELTQGLFNIGDSWFLATKYKDGYHPETMIMLPNWILEHYHLIQKEIGR